MIVTTTNTLQDHRIEDYLGIVTGEAIQGAHIGRDILAGLRDVFGGRAGAYETTLREAREEALREMVHAAKARGADAVIAVDIDYEVLGKAGGMLMVTAAGTAVKLAP
ncbi:MAG: YbjQ family protein [Gemmatimonadales bacterium]|jgi:uncharacterized protein YbjQ (UPF0145 family)|nr:MAG: YbjQ family protein [Gemmatimonadales bacterium]